MLVWGNCISILCVLMCDCPPCPFSSDQVVFAELQQANLITSEEHRQLWYTSDLVAVQRVKSPDILTKTAEVLLRHGFEKESSFLAGKQTQPLIHVLVVCGTVEPSCKGHLKASIIVSFTHTILGHSGLVPEPPPPCTRALTIG